MAKVKKKKVSVITRLRRLYHRLNPYAKPEKFPYDMEKAIAYANSIGKRVYELNEEEQKMFLL